MSILYLLFLFVVPEKDSGGNRNEDAGRDRAKIRRSEEGGEGGIEKNENEYWDRDSGRDGDRSRRRRSRGRSSDDGYEK